MLNVAVGTAVIAEAAVLGYNAMGGVAARLRRRACGRGGASYGEAAAADIAREAGDTRADITGRSLGNWVALLPTKMGGGTYAIDLNSEPGARPRSGIGTTATTIRSRIISAPSRASDPAHGFEFVNTTQGGQNSLIYGIPTNVTAETAPAGINIYRVRYDGTQMQADRERLGDDGPRPRRARHRQSEGRAVLFRDRRPEGHRRLLRSHHLEGEGGAAVRLDAQRRRTCARPGSRAARSRSRRSIPTRRPASTTTAAPRATRSTGKWCRWASCSSRKAPCPAKMPLTPDRRRRHDLASLRPLGGDRGAACAEASRILDLEKNFEPAAFLQFNKDLQDQYQVEQDRQGHAGRSCSTRSTRPATRSASRPTARSW